MLSRNQNATSEPFGVTRGSSASAGARKTFNCHNYVRKFIWWRYKEHCAAVPRFGTRSLASRLMLISRQLLTLCRA